ncbi:MAG: transcription elongation factor GreA [Chloroflexi bacterium]|nr:transcription elongation factor GreA [Chloroflexota bacterium]
MPEKTFPVTRDGMQRLQRELHELRTVKRREIADRIHAAREFSTTQNNAEYDDAKNELEIVEGRIRTLEQQVQLAVLIDEERAHHASSVVIGSTVVVKQDSKEREYTIVGPTEADPPSGRISNESPVGKALLGKRVGDDVQVMAPRGVMRMTVTGIK